MYNYEASIFYSRNVASPGNYSLVILCNIIMMVIHLINVTNYRKRIEINKIIVVELIILYQNNA